MDLETEARRRGKKLRILVTRLRYMGDVILATPAVEALKKRYPGAEIYFAAERPYADILVGNPNLSGVIDLTRDVRGAIGAVARMRGMDFIAAVDLFYNPRSALLLYLSGIPIRVGGGRRFRRRLYTHVFSVSPGTRSAVMHHAEAMRIFDVEPKDSPPRIYLSESEERAGLDFLERTLGASGSGRKPILMHPGGTWPSKRWSPDSFAGVAALARKRLNAQIAIITGPGEESIAREVEARSGGAAKMLPPQSLRSVAAAVASSRGVVANDGGILHMAVALGRPTVGVFGPTEPDIWFPYEGKGPFALVRRDMECAPCHKHQCEDLHCLSAIGADEVFRRLEEVLAWKQ
ncbi:MAG: glycosyltransferase family 9 protein [Candidatus Krumholzibacteria bacterium]|nr:glycosyltransferase family 9 protein [Candidatus Krumholzibacteria bacterium]